MHNTWCLFIYNKKSLLFDYKNYPFKLQLNHFFKIKCNKNILLQLNLKKRVKKKKNEKRD